MCIYIILVILFQSVYVQHTTDYYMLVYTSICTWQIELDPQSLIFLFCHPTQRLHFAHGAKHAVMALSQHSTMHVITFMRWALIPRPRSHVRALCPPVFEFLWTQGGGPQQASKHPLHNGLAECVANHVSDLPV